MYGALGELINQCKLYYSLSNQFKLIKPIHSQGGIGNRKQWVASEKKSLINAVQIWMEVPWEIFTHLQYGKLKLLCLSNNITDTITAFSQLREHMNMKQKPLFECICECSPWQLLTPPSHTFKHLTPGVLDFLLQHYKHQESEHTFSHCSIVTHIAWEFFFLLFWCIKGHTHDQDAGQ